VTDLHGGVKGLAFAGSAKATLRDRYPFESRLTLEKADLAALQKLVPGVSLPLAVRGSLTLSATARGTLLPLSVDGSGRVEAEGLRLDAVAVGSVSADWKSDGATLKLNKLQARLYKGTATGSAVVPLKETLPGAFDLTLADLDLGALGRDLK